MELAQKLVDFPGKELSCKFGAGDFRKSLTKRKNEAFTEKRFQSFTNSRPLSDMLAIRAKDSTLKP